MPTIKVTAGTASVEIEATEVSAKELAELALTTLHKAHTIEKEVNAARAADVGGYS